jgi:aspartate/methionine/tyrosine aminotransferase
MSPFQPFVMERMMSKWENVVAANLSESGVHPLTLGELLETAGVDPGAIADVAINYPQANGTIALRETIAALYPGATADNVLVTVGAAEANYLAMTTLLEPGDEAVILLPNYMQVWGIARNRGVRVKECHLVEERGWAPDLAALDALVGPETRLIAVCNPNNPTGRIMTEAEMAAVVRVAERHGAWLLADEVYRGAERETDEETPSFFGRYDRVLAQGSTSKAYGLPGLRIGWSVGPAATLDGMWARHEYTTISTTALSNRLAAIALSERVRPRILARTRRYIREGFPVLEGWMRRHGDLFQYVPPQAAAIAFVRYGLAVSSTELVVRLRDERSVLIVPGDHFGIDGHLRISYGLPRDYLLDGLERIHATLVEIRESGG